MKFLLAFLFLILGGALFFLMQTPENEEATQEISNPDQKVSSRNITTSSNFSQTKNDSSQPRKAPNRRNNPYGSKKEKEIQLELKEAVNNELFGGMITGAQASGSLVIFDNQIQSLILNLTPFGKAPINFQLEGVPLETAGSFIQEGSEDEIISGILSPSGDKNYILRFATGPLTGSTFLFEIIGGLEERVASEEAQMAQATAASEQVETQDMNQAPEMVSSEMNNDLSKVEEMPVNDVAVNQEMEVANSYTETSPADMQESTDGPGFNF